MFTIATNGELTFDEITEDRAPSWLDAADDAYQVIAKEITSWYIDSSKYFK